LDPPGSVRLDKFCFVDFGATNQPVNFVVHRKPSTRYKLRSNPIEDIEDALQRMGIASIKEQQQQIIANLPPLNELWMRINTCQNGETRASTSHEDFALTNSTANLPAVAVPEEALGRNKSIAPIGFMGSVIPYSVPGFQPFKPFDISWPFRPLTPQFPARSQPACEYQTQERTETPKTASQTWVYKRRAKPPPAGSRKKFANIPLKSCGAETSRCASSLSQRGGLGLTAFQMHMHRARLKNARRAAQTQRF